MYEKSLDQKSSLSRVVLTKFHQPIVTPHHEVQCFYFDLSCPTAMYMTISMRKKMILRSVKGLNVSDKQGARQTSVASTAKDLKIEKRKKITTKSICIRGPKSLSL